MYLPVRLRGKGPAHATELCGTDISASGLFLLMRNPPPPGTNLMLEFDLSPLPGMVTAEARVIKALSAENEEDETRWGASVLFTGLPEEDKKRLKEWVLRLAKFEPRKSIPMPAPSPQEPAPTPTVEEKAPAPEAVPEEAAEANGEVEVRVRLEGFQYLTRHHEVKMTPEGLFIQTDAPLPTGSRVSLEMQAAGEDHVYRAKGQVMRLVTTRIPAKENVTPGMSIRITGCDEATRNFLKELLNKRTETSF